MLCSDRLENRRTGIISKLDEDMKDDFCTEVDLVSISGEDNRGDGPLVEEFEENITHLLERDGLYARMPNNLGYESDDRLERVLFNQFPQHPGDAIGVHHITIPIRLPVFEKRIRVRLGVHMGNKGSLSLDFEWLG